MKNSNTHKEALQPGGLKIQHMKRLYLLRIKMEQDTSMFLATPVKIESPKMSIALPLVEPAYKSVRRKEINKVNMHECVGIMIEITL